MHRSKVSEPEAIELIVDPRRQFAEEGLKEPSKISWFDSILW